MTLPIDRTALTAATTNQVPNSTLRSALNIAALTTPYNTIDELNNKVDANHAAGGTGTTQLADGSVTTAKHADGSVTTAKIADSAVTLAKMADSSVGTTELVDLAVTNEKVANETLTAAKFVAGALTNETQNALRITELEAEYASISNWNDNLVNALAASDYVYIPKNTTLTLSTTLVKANLNGKKIRGEGITSIIQVVGNINPFNFTGCQYSELQGVLIEVENTNTQTILKFGEADTTFSTSQNKVTDINIRCVGSTQGEYRGIELYSDEKGVLTNTFKSINIFAPGEGVLLHAERKVTKSGSAWITFNTFISVFVQSMKRFGFETRQTEIANAGTQISHNNFIDAKVQDAYNAATVRYGFLIGSGGDTFTNPRTFSDSLSGTFYGLSFNANIDSNWKGQYNHVLGGAIEGAIDNEYKNCNTIDVFYIYQPNFSTPPSGEDFTRYTNNIVNALYNSNLSNAREHWSSSDSMSVAAEPSATFGRCLRITSVLSSSMAIYQNLPNPANYAGKKSSLIMCVRFSGFTGSPTVSVSIDESVAGSKSKSYTATGDWQIITVDKLLAGSGGVIQLKTSVANGLANVTLEVAWAMFTTNGYCREVNYHPSTGGVGVNNVSGIATIPTGSTSVMVTHNLGFVPAYYRIRIVPTNSLGNATKYWVDSASTTQFRLNLNVDPATVSAGLAWGFEG